MATKEVKEQRRKQYKTLRNKSRQKFSRRVNLEKFKEACLSKALDYHVEMQGICLDNSMSKIPKRGRATILYENKGEALRNAAMAYILLNRPKRATECFIDAAEDYRAAASCVNLSLKSFRDSILKSVESCRQSALACDYEASRRGESGISKFFH